MPKLSSHVLRWSEEHQHYELTTSGKRHQSFQREDDQLWLAWLSEHTTFSFQGRAGNLSVIKEVRSRGAGYWYAYRTRDRQTRKRYLGHTATVTLAHLEEVAQALANEQALPSRALQPEEIHAPLHRGLDAAQQAVAPGQPLVLSSLLQGTFLLPKFQAPLPLASHVKRPRLLEQLEAVFTHPLTLLSASAGWGKTTLLSAWTAQHSQQVAWLSLDDQDNDLSRFWLTVIAALRHCSICSSSIGDTALTLLQPPHAPAWHPFLTALSNELMRLQEEVVLILDDYHVIDEPTIHASLTFWLEHLPSHVHLVLASRVDPALSLSRLRVHGHLFELRDADLRFTREEAQHFLVERMGLALSESDVERLEARTEGWIASLQLASLFLQRLADPSTGVLMLSGSQRFLLEYLREEILASLPEDVQDFLFQTSWLNPLSASLCDAVRGKEDSHLLLERVERANLFLQPLDESRQWYRYHALWAQAMQHEARLRLGPAVLRSLSCNASLWYEQQRLLPEAIEAALTGEAFARAATLIGQFLDPNSFHNEYRLICSWLRRLPEEVLQAQPELSFLYALALLFITDRRSSALWARIELLLQWAVQRFQAKEQWEQLGEALQLYAGLAFFQEDLVKMLALLHQAQPLLTEHSLLYPVNLALRGYEALLAGEVQAAWQHLLEGYRRAQNLGDYSTSFVISLILSAVCLEKGELSWASHYTHQALAHLDDKQETLRQQLLLETGDVEPFFVSWAYHCLAQLSYERNEMAAAQRYVSQALTLRGQSEEEIHLLASRELIQARLLHTSGEAGQALDMLSKWEMHARFPWSVRAIRACRARLQLADGNLSAVKLWAQEKQYAFHSQAPEQEEELPLLHQQEEALLLARLHIAQKRGESVLKELVFWKEKAQIQGRRRSVLEIQILEALAHLACQEHSQARSALLQALRLAQPENAQRLFLDEGPIMECLLKTLLPALDEAPLTSFVRTLLRAFAQKPGLQLAEETSPSRTGSALLGPLTEREQEVLHLLAEGASNQEIAAQMVIQLSTAKKHVSTILGKLGAESRTQAVALARERLLL